MKPTLLTVAATACLILAACKPAEAPAPSAPPEPATPAQPSRPTTPATPVPPAKSRLTPEGQPIERPISCTEERGEVVAKRLVERCIHVSPATRPPCNASNPCALIEGEIKRSCEFFDDSDKPAECAG